MERGREEGRDRAGWGERRREGDLTAGDQQQKERVMERNRGRERERERKREGNLLAGEQDGKERESRVKM